MDKLTWSRESVPDELHSMLEILGREYSISESGRGISVEFKRQEKGLNVERERNKAVIKYDSIATAARGVGSLLSGIAGPGCRISETNRFKTIGIMMDVSRNAVMKVEHFKKWLRRLSLFGYNLAMLYTKDTYELPGEDFFGYLRGRYSADELKEIDSYAANLGIEMVGCIQALGHLEPVLRWPAYWEIRDTASVLLTSEEKTYQLIDKMLKLYSDVFRSRRIHVGMDETHDLGRGRYMDLNGYRSPCDIFCAHLEKVKENCRKYGLKPMVWSDMFFKMANKAQAYYDREDKIPENIKNLMPKDIQLVYWDYYHEDREFYVEWIKRHRELGFNPVMASGIWTWGALWYDSLQTEKTVLPCLDACVESGVNEVFFTMWGDDGAYCDIDSGLAGICLAAERIYSGGKPREETMKKRFKSLCGGNYDAHMKASEIARLPISSSGNTDDCEINGAMVLWDDPLLGIYWKFLESRDSSIWIKALKKYSETGKALSAYDAEGAGDISHARLIAGVLEKKIDLNIKLYRAYTSRNKKEMEKVRELIPCLIECIDGLLCSFRKNWYSRNKPFGFEVIQIRFAGQKERLKELHVRLNEYITGQIDSIPELEEKASSAASLYSTYSSLATGSYFI